MANVEQPGDDAEATQPPREIKRIHVHGPLNAVAWNFGGSELAALSNYGGTVTLFDSTHWTQLNQFEKYGGAYSNNSLAFLRDDSLLTSTPAGGALTGRKYDNADPRYPRLDIFSLIQWAPRTGKVVRYLPDLGDPPGPMPEHIHKSDRFAVSADGSLVAGIAGVVGYGIFLYESKTGKLLMVLNLPQSGRQSNPRSLAFSPNGRELAVGVSQGIVYVFDLGSGEISRSFIAYPNQEFACGALAFSPDGRFLATGRYKRFNIQHENIISVDIWDMETGSIVNRLEGVTSTLNNRRETAPVSTMAWSRVGNRLAIGDMASLRVWSISEPEPRLLLSREMPLGSYSVAFSRSGLLAATNKDTIYIYQ
jgi:WD40 repeat protein